MYVTITLVDDEGNKVIESILLRSGVVDMHGNVFTEEALQALVRDINKRTIEWNHGEKRGGMADTSVLKADDFGHEGSTPSAGTQE
jgi:hypothetical protein